MNTTEQAAARPVLPAPKGRVSGAQLAAAMRWLWPVIDPLMGGELHKWSDEDLLEAHCADWVRDKALSMLSAALTAAPAGGWVPVAPDSMPPTSDFLPPEPGQTRVSNKVIVATNEGRVFETTYHGSMGFANLNSRTDFVTHWQPLPSPPTA